MCYENKVSLKNPEPFDGKSFKGRIAFSSDDNYNDEDDWGDFPVAIAILDAFGIVDKLVHTEDEIIVEVNADAGESGKLDYVQLNYKGSSPITYKYIKTRFSVTGLHDNTNALPGQIIVVGENPGYLKYSGGEHTFCM